MLKELQDGLAVSMNVQPRSSRNTIVHTPDNQLKAYLTSPPVDGAANRSCIELLAKLLHLPKSKISLLSGQKSRNKVFKIEGITVNDFLAALQVNIDKN